MRQATLLALIFLAACCPYPRDTVGTLDRVTQSHVIRVGMIAGVARSHRVLAFLKSIEGVTGAKAQPIVGNAEDLIARLDADQLDMMIGEVATDSPWISEVAVIEPLSTRRIGNSDLGLSPIARNGENRWIMILEKQVRASGAQ